MNSTNLEFFEPAVDDFFKNKTQYQKRDIGLAQWSGLHQLEQEYDQLSMSEFGENFVFSDNKWPLKEDGLTTVDWGRCLSPSKDNYPLIVMLKVTFYYHIQIRKVSQKSLRTPLGLFLNTFGLFFANHKILKAQENQVFVPASSLTTDKVTAIVAEAVREEKIGSDHLLRFFDLVNSVPRHLFSSALFLHVSVITPWSEVVPIKGFKRTTQYFNDITGRISDLSDVKSYKAFSPKVCGQIVDFCLPIVTEHQKKLSRIINLVINPDSYAKARRGNIRGEYLIASVRKEVQKHGEFLQSVYPIRYLDGSTYNGVAEKNKRIGAKWARELYQTCQSAALWILLLTTALRNIDIRLSLMRECYTSVDDSKLMHYLITDISKVGKTDYPIPIPPQTVSAIDFLNSINFAPKDVQNLVVKHQISSFKHKQSHWHFNAGNELNNRMRKLAEDIGVDLLDGLEEDENPEGLAHRCRATMAGWIGTNSPMAVLLVKRLFGHTNEIMPNSYLEHNKDVQKIRAEIRKATYIDMSENIAIAVVDNKISGGIKKRLTEGRNHLEALIKDENGSMTGPELRETLIERLKKELYVRLSNGEMLGLQTPLTYICTRNPSSSIDAPCNIQSNKVARIKNDIDKAFVAGLQMTSLPNLDNCKGQSCPHSLLYDNPITKLLLEQYKYYSSYKVGMGQTDIDEVADAKRFIELYANPLIEVYPEIIQLEA